jgi:hypothetical protein
VTEDMTEHLGPSTPINIELHRSRCNHGRHEFLKVDCTVCIEVKLKEHAIDFPILNQCFPQLRKALFNILGGNLFPVFGVEIAEDLSKFDLYLIIDSIPTHDGDELIDIVTHFLSLLEDK